MKSTEQRRKFDGDKTATARPTGDLRVPAGASPGYPGWQCRSCGHVHSSDYKLNYCNREIDPGRYCKGSLWRYIKLEIKH